MKKSRYIILPVTYIIWGILLYKLSLTKAISQSQVLLFQGLGIMILGVFLFKDDLKEAWKDLQAKPHIWAAIIKTSLILFILNPIIRGVLLILLQNFITFDTLGQNQQILEETQANVSPLIFAFSVALAAPFNEELIFRHSLNHWVPQNNPIMRWTMAVLSTLLFAAAHVFQLQDFILYLPLSISIYWLYAKFDRNIWAPIVFHFINNTLALILMTFIQ